MFTPDFKQDSCERVLNWKQFKSILYFYLFILCAACLPFHFVCTHHTLHHKIVRHQNMLGRSFFFFFWARLHDNASNCNRMKRVICAVCDCSVSAALLSRTSKRTVRHRTVLARCGGTVCTHTHTNTHTTMVYCECAYVYYIVLC